MLLNNSRFAFLCNGQLKMVNGNFFDNIFFLTCDKNQSKPIYNLHIHGFVYANEEEEMNWIYVPVPVISVTCS